MNENFIWIAHRGNLYGPKPELENRPTHIDYVVNQPHTNIGVVRDVEVDIWLVEDEWFFGHDYPEYKAPPIWCDHRQSASLWYHAKNVAALEELNHRRLHVFWHDDAPYTMTNRGYIWVHPNIEKIPSNGIVVMPEKSPHLASKEYCNNVLNSGGICSDFAGELKKTPTIECLQKIGQLQNGGRHEN